MSNNIFTISLLISFLAHSAVLLVNTGKLLYLYRTREVPVEIIYMNKNLKLPQYKETAVPPKKDILKMSPWISSKDLPPPYINKEDILNSNVALLSRKTDFMKPSLSKPEVGAIKKKISLPPVDLNRIDNPSYLSYYQIVREKIRRAAYQSYTKTETGEVYLTFLLSKSGALIDERLIMDRSSTSEYLKDVASRSIKNASPFPPFPKELDYPQLSFNVIISFEIE